MDFSFNKRKGTIKYDILLSLKSDMEKEILILLENNTAITHDSLKFKQLLFRVESTRTV